MAANLGFVTVGAAQFGIDLMEDRAVQVLDDEGRAHGFAAGLSASSALVSEFASVVVTLLAEKSGLKGKLVYATPDDAIVSAFMQAALSGTARTFDALLAHFRQTRITHAMVADVYIPEAARRMGEAWLDDELSWLDVSIATARLQSLLREISAAWTADQADNLGLGAVLLLVPEGEQHTLGPLVAMGQIRRMGISVCLRFGPSHRELTALLSERQFDGIMISAATEARLQSVAFLIRFMRSMRKKLPPIVVGGPIAMTNPQLKACTGADFACNGVDTAMEAIGLNVVEAGPLKRA